jgi:hypothetical protein
VAACDAACEVLARRYTDFVARARNRSAEVRDALVTALDAKTDRDAADALERVSEHLLVITSAFPDAVRGQWPAIVVLVHGWHSFIDDLVASAAIHAPDLVRKAEDHFDVLTAGHRWSPEPIHHLDRLLIEVPFHPWVARFGLAVGSGVVAVDAMKFLLPGGSRLQVMDSLGWPDLPEGASTERFQRLTEIALRAGQPPLVRVKELFELSDTELSMAFGVSRQAVSQWLDAGDVPPARRAKLANLLFVGEFLERKLKAGRLPLVARRRAANYSDKSMLEMIAEGRDEELREVTERWFDWSTTA